MIQLTAPRSSLREKMKRPAELSRDLHSRFVDTWLVYRRGNGTLRLTAPSSAPFGATDVARFAVHADTLGVRSAPKGSNMWRFLAAGLVTVCGVVLLFAASFGDPQVMLRDARALLPVFQTRSPTSSTAASAMPEVARTSPAPAQPGPVEQAPAPLSALGPAPASTLSGAAALAPPTVSGPGLDAAALLRQRDDLQKQLEAMRAKIAEQR